LEKEIVSLVSNVETFATRGLNLEEERLALLDFPALEKQVFETLPADTENDRLLKAAAEAVAEAGPWDASMEMVARHSGLAKSSLYSHFKNKQDMLGRLFITELKRISEYAEGNIRHGKNREERLYLALVSVAGYLRSRPEILVALDWFRTRRPGSPDETKAGNDRRLSRIYRIFDDAQAPDGDRETEAAKDETAQMILFLIISVLMTPRGGGGCTVRTVSRISNESFRLLFRYIARGLEGFNV
jgi:AcrR family transcriptional regulator